MLSQKSADRLYNLHTGIIGTGTTRHERPHKPCMLLAALDLLATGQVDQDRIEWSTALFSRFVAYFEIVKTQQDQKTPENPFLYLRRENFWHPKQVDGKGTVHPLAAPPLRGDKDTGKVFASIDWDFANFLDPIEREEAREILVSRYFPENASSVKALFWDPEHTRKIDVQEADQDLYPTRSASFRKVITEIYDYQCAACGLRINIHPGNITFVDAAHIIPFTESHNDHPTNGIALCKNHHWAMDQNLIAPNPEGIWSVSKILDRRRSKGEEILIDLAGEPILSPKEPAYAPSRDALRWRCDRLLA
jgi:putative restriction endonuclease